MAETRHAFFRRRTPNRYLVGLYGEVEPFLKFEVEARKPGKTKLRTRSRLAEQEIYLREILHVKRHATHKLGLIIHMRYVASSVQSGADIMLDVETEEERESWIDAIDRLLGDAKPHRFLETQKKGFLKRIFG